MSQPKKSTLPQSSLTFCFLLLLLVTTGCQTTVGNYFANRVQDLRDVAGVAFSVGPGVSVAARVTGWVQVEGTALYAYKAGTWRRGAGLWQQTDLAGGVAPLLWLRDVRRASVLGDIESGNSVLWLSPGGTGHFFHWVGPGDWSQQFGHGEQGFWDIGICLHLLLVGVEAYVNPVEFIDFILGWFGVDIMGDDTVPGDVAPVEDEQVGRQLESSSDDRED